MTSDGAAVGWYCDANVMLLSFATVALYVMSRALCVNMTLSAVSQCTCHLQLHSSVHSQL